MAFNHGKAGRLWVDAFELTRYFTEFVSAAKAGIAETTVMGLGAKTFIGGLKEGQITGKGFFDGSVNAIDQVLTAALGRNVNMTVTFSPSGGVAVNTRVVVAFAAETDLSITSPVNNVVAVSFAANADSGLTTGYMLKDPTDAALTGSATFGAPTNLTYSAGANTATVTATGSTALFLPAGTAIIAGATPGVFSYTGLSGSTFTGCKVIRAVVTPSGAISQGYWDGFAAATTTGLVMNVHALTMAGTGTAGTVTPKLQHSANGSTWADLIGGTGPFTFGDSAFDTTTGVQATTGVATANVTINPFIRLVLTTVDTGNTDLSATLMASVARQ